MVLIIIIGVVVLGVVLLRPYIQRFDNLVLYTGTLGSGKTFSAVKTSLMLLKRNRIKVAFYNAMPWHKEKRLRPLLYSNVPVLVSKRRKEFSARLKAEHFTMAEAIIPRSVVLIDEVSLVLSQMDYKTVNDQALAEFFSLYRQYTRGGYLVATTQSVAKCQHSIRRCLDSAYRLQNFRTFLGLFYVVQVRHIDICEDTINVNDRHSEDATQRLFGLVPLFRRYDTYCYFPRYKRVPIFPTQRHKALDTKHLCKIPVKTKLPCYVDNSDDLYVAEK